MNHSRFSVCFEKNWFVMLDGFNSYNKLSENKNCIKNGLIYYESYDKIIHLTVINCIHNLIEEKVQKYKVSALKYIK